jgi:hypothetical protein
MVFPTVFGRWSLCIMERVWFIVKLASGFRNGWINNNDYKQSYEQFINPVASTTLLMQFMFIVLDEHRYRISLVKYWFPRTCDHCNFTSLE